MSTYIPLADQPTSAWLTSVLYVNGMLKQGEVANIIIKDTGAFNSQTCYLIVQYSPDASTGLPTQLVLKRNALNEYSTEAGIDEVRFYNLAASLQTYPPATIRCYAADFDQDNNNSYILLPDLSATHMPPLTRAQQIGLVESVPTQEHIEAVTDALAQIHAYWWNHPLLYTNELTVGYWTRNAERFDAYLQRRKRSWESLIADEKDWFPADLQELYEQVLAHLPYYWQKYLEPRFRSLTNLTLQHGDSYFANFLAPKIGTSGATYLIDWQSYMFDLGGTDLVNLCAPFWTSEQRHEGQREEKVLRSYHDSLQKYGVQDYTWDNLRTDYQTGLIEWLMMPVQDRFGGSVKSYWWPKMQCLVAAFRDWHCADLLDMQ